MKSGSASFDSPGDRSSRQQFVMDDTSYAGKPKKKGCFLSRPVGLVLVLVAAVIAAGVGLGVYFLAPRHSATSEADEWSACLSLAEKRGECACPGSLTTTTTTTQAVTSPTTPMTTPTPPLPTGNRLNRTFVPYHYQVELTPRFYEGDDFGFSGSVDIDMTCQEASDAIVLHAYMLTVHSSSIKISRSDGNDSSNTTLSIVRWDEDVSRQFLKLWVSEPLVQNATYRLSMDFNGTHIHPDWAGFYRSSYKEDGVEKYLVLTFMAPAYARRVFPCFDEPSFKANFDISLVRKREFSTIANMPLKTSQDRGDGWVADVYNTTVVMSPYLLAFIVSEFQSKNMTTPRGTFMRLWARPKFIDYLDYALNVSGPIMEAFEDYTGIKYPLPKTDQIAVPDFAAGAMENWGLVTYRETALLVNDAYTDTSSKRYVASVIAHELAHQWWGNLVTCEWWDETWLNEGFANNYADVMAAVAEPKWKMNEYFIRTVWSALERDGVATSQPVFVAGIEHHSELYRGFNSITYRKGGSVIRMMKYFLSEETFRSGISAYLARHAYGNTRREDLYRALEEQAVKDNTVSWDTSKANFSDIMETWIAQMGHPIVDIADLGNGSLKVDQQHFLYDNSLTVPASPVGKNGEYVWHIPLTFANKEQRTAGNSSRVWIYGDKSALVPIPQVPGWKLVNLFEQGFYRVRYSSAIWESILQQLKENHLVFPVENRGELLNDAFNLARAGELDELSALRATEYLKNETEYLPLYAGLVNRLRQIEGWLYPTSAQSLIYQYVYDLVHDKYASTSWDNSNPSEHLEKYIRTIILRENCEKRHAPCLEKAASLYASYMASPDNNPIHPDFRSFVYCTAIGNGGVVEFGHALDRLELMATERDVTYIGYERNALRDGLSCVRQPWLVTRYLDYAWQNGETNMMVAIAQRWEAQGQVWDFLVQNWNNASFSQSRTAVLNAITTYWSTETHMRKVKDLANMYPVPSGDKTYEDVLDNINKNVRWLETNMKPIGDWLALVNSGQSNKFNYLNQPEVQSTPARRRRREATNPLHTETLAKEDLLRYENAIY